MTKYLTETHAHTKEVSPCAHVHASRLVDLYIDAGYTTIVITDHYSPHTLYDINSLKPSDIVDRILKGYRAALEHAKGRINVLPGMELNFYENYNDYLVYGITEDFIRQNPDILSMGLSKFSTIAKEIGLLIFQAHPFRNHMTVVNPSLLTGIEVHNGNPRHDSRNDIASAWAQKFNLLTIAGSDFHQECDIARGGILTSEPLTDNQTLLTVLKNQPEIYSGDSQSRE